MPTPRFFIDAPTDAFQLGGRFELPPKTARHAGRSLRLAAGEIVELFNGTGAAWSGPVGFSDASAWVELEHRTDRTAESPLAITLLQSLVAPEKADWIVEKAVEAGISEIVFMPAERSVTKLAGERLEKRLARLTDIARSAAEQCGRNVVPLVRAVPSLEAGFKTVSGDVKFVLAPGARCLCGFEHAAGAPLRRLCRRTRGRVLCSRNRARRRSRLAASASGAAYSAHRNRRTGRGYLGSDTCR